jgi:hypothetical protein
MNLKEYFEKHKGTGVFSTSAKDGTVNSAIYSRPHMMDDGTAAFIMRDRLSHQNITENSHAVFLFKEDEKGHSGKRLYLTRIKEEKNTTLIDELRRRAFKKDKYPDEDVFLVYFSIDKERPLVGD